jgi:hypothetical protein
VFVFQLVFLDHDLKHFLSNQAVHEKIAAGGIVKRNAPHFSILSSFLLWVKKYSSLHFGSYFGCFDYSKVCEHSSNANCPSVAAICCLLCLMCCTSNVGRMDFFVINKYITNDLCLIAFQKILEKMHMFAPNYSMHTQRLKLDT